MVNRQDLVAQRTTGRPTKLFIGGISRHTTTKQLRDHFSAHGRVLDCVAMRQPDGRSRGFGYVTLDSQEAAERCLGIPQVIDSRIVEMKLAVPEGSQGSSATTTRTQARPKHLAPLYSGLYTQYGDQAYAPSNFGFFGMLDPMPVANFCFAEDYLPEQNLIAYQWTASYMEALAGVGAFDVDSVDESSLPVSGMPDVGDNEVDVAVPQAELPGLLLPPIVVAIPPTTAPLHKDISLTPRSDELVPGDLKLAAPLKVKHKDPSRRTPLGELTNVSACPKGSRAQNDGIFESRRPASRGSFAIFADGEDTMMPDFQEVVNETPVAESAADTKRCPCSVASDEKCIEPEESKDRVSKVVSDPEFNGETDSEESDGEVEAPLSTDDLPSAGSACHPSGQCRRCNFYSRGRCQNGKDCTFCHLSHHKLKASRQEKRERTAAWLQEQDEGQSPGEDCSCIPDSPAFLGLPPVLLSGMPTIDVIGSVNNMATEGFNSVTLSTTPLATPGMSAPVVRTRLQPQPLQPIVWQPDEEVSPRCLSLLGVLAEGPHSVPHASLLGTTPPSQANIVSVQLMSPQAALQERDVTAQIFSEQVPSVPSSPWGSVGGRDRSSTASNVNTPEDSCQYTRDELLRYRAASMEVTDPQANGLCSHLTPVLARTA